MKYLIGIDEVGRGCLAGPITVAAVAAPQGIRFKAKGLRLKDSKKLTKKQRGEWLEYIKQHPKIHYAVGRCQPKTIDKINISKAANRAATAALRRLLRHKIQGIRFKEIKVLLDGGLYVSKSFNLRPNTLKTIVRGDEKYNCIKLASIVAKTSRDKFMNKVHKIYPKYGFNRHVGYGTKQHIQAVKKHGISPIHRLTFTKNFV